MCGSRKRSGKIEYGGKQQFHSELIFDEELIEVKNEELIFDHSFTGCLVVSDNFHVYLVTVQYWPLVLQASGFLLTKKV